METPIATYKEQRFDGKRNFTLFSDRVTITGGDTLGARYDLTVPLASLNPNADRVWRRPNGFGAGVTVLVVSIGVLQAFQSAIVPGWKGWFVASALVGLLLALGTMRRVEWAVFRNSMGQAILSVARAGPQRKNFEGFVGAVKAAILAADVAARR
jgi:hypothetical protein